MAAPPARLHTSGVAVRHAQVGIAWAGAALFAGSLAYFLFSYVVTFGEITAGTLRPAAVVADIGLFTAFALHHSVFAREPVRRLVARMVSPPLERSVYVWIASLMLIGVCAWWQPLPGALWQVTGTAAWFLPLAQLGGGWLTLRSAAVIDVWELAGVRQVSGRGEVPAGGGLQASGVQAPAVEFRTDGPYGWVRHPIYFGWLLLVFPVATMTMTRLAFAVISTVYILIAIPLEERSLRRTSGGAYDGYMRQVRWKLIPGVY